MSNPLLNASENAALAALRSNGAAFVATPTLSTKPTAWNPSRINWHALFIRATQGLVVASGGFIAFKLYAVWQVHPGVAFLPFLDLHPPMALFSGLIVFWFIQQREYESVAIIALFSTMLNALLV